MALPYPEPKTLEEIQADLESLVGGPSRTDMEVGRAKRLVIGYDDDPDITDNVSSLLSNSLLVRYSTAYANKVTRSAIQSQRYIKADTGAPGSAFRATTILGAENGSDTPVRGNYQAEWCINVELDDYSDLTTGVVSVGISSTVRRYGAQSLMAIHCNAMDMRCPSTAADSSMGGITGMESHSDGIGPDHRTSGGNDYGYRQTIRCTARTKDTLPTWTKRGSVPFQNGATVAVDAICLPKDANLSVLPYLGTYFVCVTGGVLGASSTALDAATVPGTRVTDGGAIWECRIGAEVGQGIVIRNGDASDTPSTAGYYRYGLIIDNAASMGNANQIAHALYITNSGLINIESYGDPGYHLFCKGIAAEAALRFGTESMTGDIASFEYRAHNSNDAEETFAKIVVTNKTNTVNVEYGRITFTVTANGVGQQHLILEDENTIIGKKNVLAASATVGFLHIGYCAGAPTGTPTTYSGKCPMVVDSVSNRLYLYISGEWHYAQLSIDKMFPARSNNVFSGKVPHVVVT